MTDSLNQTPPGLTIGYINIGGLSKGGGRPANYAWLCDLAHSVDILCVSEVWLHDVTAAQAYTPPGCKALCYALRPAPSGPGRPHGGIIIYCRNTSRHRLGPHQVSLDTPNGIVWLSFPKHRLCLACCYLAPSGTPWFTDDTIPILERGITRWQGRGYHAILMGDLNARMGNMDNDVPCMEDVEYAPPTPACTDLQLYIGIPKPRTTQDNTKNSRGTSLMDSLRTCQLVCLNGRHPGDANGCYTFTSRRGSSVVDYTCVGASLYCLVSDFTILSAPPSHPLGGVHHALRVALALPTMRPSAHSPTRRPVVCRPPVHLDAWQKAQYPKQQLAAQAPHLQALRNDMHAGTITLADGLHRLISLIRAATLPPRPSTHNNDAPPATPACSWWDDTCAQQKNVMRAAHRYWLRMSRGSDAERILHARDTYLTARSTYQSLCRGKKRKWQADQEEALVQAAVHNPSKFWRHWAPHKSPLPITDVATWDAYFIEVFNPPTHSPSTGDMAFYENAVRTILTNEANAARAALTASHPDLIPSTNVPLTPAEVADSLYSLHSGKAADAMGVTIEALRACWRGWEQVGPPPGDTAVPTPPAPHELFRACLLWVLQRMWTDAWPPSLTQCLLTPIPKGAPSTDIQNYRGIAVSHTFVRLHEHILFTRADKASEAARMRSITQCGFRKKHGSLDAIFTLNHLIQQARHHKKSLYVIFIDFKKAFDLVPRQVLLDRCAALGFQGELLAAITRLYDRVEYVVQVEGHKGQPIPTTSGTKQGSHISPLLFGWVIEQLHTLIMHRWGRGQSTAEDPTPTLAGGAPDDPLQQVLDILFADDSTLIAGSIRRAQSYLHLLRCFCGLFGFQVNLVKTTWVHFRPPRTPVTAESLTFAGQPLTRVSEVHYMGLWWHDIKGLMASHLPHAHTIAHRANHGLFARMKSRHIQRPALQCRLFRTMVRSAFSFGCQIWGAELLPALQLVLTGAKPFRVLLSSVPEQAQLHFLRILAGVGNTCHLQMLLHEFGMLPVTFHYARLLARFWNRTLSTTSMPLLYRALRSDIHLMLSGCKSCWSYHFLTTMHGMQLGPPPHTLTQMDLATCLTLRFDEKEVAERLESMFYEYLLPPTNLCPRRCDSDHIKGRTYNVWLGMEPGGAAPHVSKFIPRDMRILLTRLRLDCSDLEVVQGRYVRGGAGRPGRIDSAGSIGSEIPLLMVFVLVLRISGTSFWIVQHMHLLGPHPSSAHYLNLFLLMLLWILPPRSCATSSIHPISICSRFVFPVCLIYVLVFLVLPMLHL